MAISLSWKVTAAVAGLLVAGLAWHGILRYRATQQADLIIQQSERTAQLQAQQTQEQLRQRHDAFSATLAHRREELAQNYQQVVDQGRELKALQEAQLERQRQAALRVAASYALSRDQQCASGIVITRTGSSFSQPHGKDGQPIRCQGNKADEPLR